MATQARPPIVAVMGHIDHGKSSLLDYIRKSNVTAGEAGGITQHVSAYEATHTYEGTERTITFLDTPGHEAFRALRSRGASASDIAILVVAADEAVKPQTMEAHAAIVEAGIPFVIAFTKIDKNGADIERAKASVLENAIYLEGLGGDIAYTGVSSKTGEGVPELLDLVLLTADLAELTADPEAPAHGFVLESTQDPKRGISATLIVKEGTLTTGSFAVAGSSIAPVRFIENFAGARIAHALPSQPVRIAGFDTLPSAGTPFSIEKSKKDAERAAHDVAVAGTLRTFDTRTEEGKAALPLILKADVTGSLEAIKQELTKVTHERAVIRVIAEGLGSVSETDVKTAQAAGAVIIAFTVGTENNARELSERLSVPIESFTIIYDLEKKVGELLAERAPNITVEETLGTAKVLKTFNVSGGKIVLGARWETGVLSLGNRVKIDRRGIPLGEGKLSNLQVARMDVQEIKMEGEFGLQVESKVEIAAGDTLTAFKMVTK